MFWMEGSEAVDVTQEISVEQFSVAKIATNKSQGMRWDDLFFQNDRMFEYKGNDGGLPVGLLQLCQWCN